MWIFKKIKNKTHFITAWRQKIFAMMRLSQTSQKFLAHKFKLVYIILFVYIYIIQVYVPEGPYLVNKIEFIWMDILYTFQCLGSILPMSLIWYFCHFFIIFLINKYKSLNTIEINNWNKIKGIFYVLPRYNDWSENNILPGICEFWYLWLNQNTSTLSNSDKVRGV